MKGSSAQHAQAQVLDNLVEQASVPNLAALFRKAKQRGLIDEAPHYQ